MKILKYYLLLGSFFLFLQTYGQYLPSSSPLAEGLTNEGIERVSKFLNEMPAKGQTPGSVTMIVRNGKMVFLQSSGKANLETGEDMREDHLFRMASMTKLVTTVGALKLFEQGYFTMDTPLETFLPEFSNPEIFESYDSKTGKFKTHPAKNKILMKHVFTHTSGITYPPFVSDGREGYLNAGVMASFPKNGANIKVSDELKKLAKLPISHEPGESWTYGMNMDILGRIIEIITGKSLPIYLKEEIFEPLNMNRTYFGVPENEWKNMAEVYATDETGIHVYTDKDLKKYFNSPNTTSMDYYKNTNTDQVFGGADMISNIKDYSRFLQMIMNNGELDGSRILSKKTIEMLETPLFDVMSEHMVAQSHGPRVQAGLSVRIMQDEIAKFQLISTGSYYWSGYFNTQFWMDRKEKMFYIVLRQHTPEPFKQNDRLKHLIWGSIGK